MVLPLPKRRFKHENHCYPDIPRAAGHMHRRARESRHRAPRAETYAAAAGTTRDHDRTSNCAGLQTYNARLQISEAALKELREATNGGATNQSFGQHITGSSTNTIIAGLFLFLSISFGGVWLARSSGNNKSHKAVAAILVASATVSTAAIIAQGNAGPPPSYLWRNLTKNLSASKTTSGPIDVEIVTEGDGIKLIVPTRDASRTDD